MNLLQFLLGLMASTLLLYVPPDVAGYPKAGDPKDKNRVNKPSCDTLISEIKTICAGDSVLVFGAYVREALHDSRAYPASNGCDSIHRVEVVVLPPVSTTETISICGGDSLLLFGYFVNEPGVYSETFTNALGCDSTHRVMLKTDEIKVSTRQIRPDCGASNPGWGEVVFESDGFFEVRWSDGSFFKRNERLFAGYTNTVTITNENGCSVVDSLIVAAAIPPEIKTYVIDESCPGANDGRIGILHNRSDLDFHLDRGPWLKESTFSDLSGGTYRITIRDGDGCKSKKEIRVGSPLETTLALSDTSLLLDLGDSLVLTPQTNYPLAKLRWFVDEQLVCTGCPELRLRPTQSAQVTAVAGENEYCAVTARASIVVNTEDLFYIPTTFNLGGDAPDEDFGIYCGPAVASVRSFELYDRWGHKVYERKNFGSGETLGWDGKLPDGSLPQPGIYVFKIRLVLFSGETVPRAGEVTLKR